MCMCRCNRTERATCAVKGNPLLTQIRCLSTSVNGTFNIGFFDVDHNAKLSTPAVTAI